MADSALAALCLGCSLLLLSGAYQGSAETQRASEATDATPEEKEMTGTLKELWGKLRRDQLLPMEKKFSGVPSCDAGEPCAIRKGARIGRLCSCPRGTSCSLYILKCL